jgi:hypothetical protein
MHTLSHGHTNTSSPHDGHTNLSIYDAVRSWTHTHPGDNLVAWMRSEREGTVGHTNSSNTSLPLSGRRGNEGREGRKREGREEIKSEREGGSSYGESGGEAGEGRTEGEGVEGDTYMVVDTDSPSGMPSGPPGLTLCPSPTLRAATSVADSRPGRKMSDGDGGRKVG